MPSEPKTGSQKARTRKKKPVPIVIENTIGDYVLEEPKWVVDGLIEVADQVLLFGPPKIGKSQLAMQFALAVARGGKLFRWKVTVPRRVLYINFEIGLRAFAVRLARQIRDTEDLPANLDLSLINQELQNFYFSRNARSMDVLSEASRKEWRKLIQTCQPEFIVFDTLAKTHTVDERDNQKIGEVLLALRAVAGEVAHLIVHHARKNPNIMNERAEMTTESIRGGSAIRGEADLILALSNRSGGAGGGKEYRLGIEARNIQSGEITLAFTGWGSFSESDVRDKVSADVDLVFEFFRKERSRVVLYWRLRKLMQQERGLTEGAASDRLKKLYDCKPPFFKKIKPTQVKELAERYPHQFATVKKGDLAVVGKESPWFDLIAEADEARAATP